MKAKIQKFKNRDDLHIVYREYGVYQPDKPTVLCLSGLTRNSKGFDEYANYLHRKFNLHVIAPDMRGRGLSDYDSIWTNYTIVIEAQDFIDLLEYLDIHHVIIIGTSRGGMQSAVMAGQIKEKIRAVILNDIGATIPITALERLSLLFQREDSYVGSYDDALSAFYKLDNGMTRNLTAQQEQSVIDSIYKKTDDNKYSIDYDLEGLRCSHTATLDHIKKTNSNVLNLSALFKNLENIPLLLLHGVHSDILTSVDIKETQKILPQTQVVSFNDRGHTLYFNEPDVIKVCEEFLSKCIH